MKGLQENTIDQIRTLIRYLTETDLLNNKEFLSFLDVIAREHGGEVADKSKWWIQVKNNILRASLLGN